MKNMWKRITVGCLSLLLMACGICPAIAETEAEMPVPFGTASANAPYYAKPCNERLASLPEALMQMAEGGYSWEYEYVADKPAYALTLMDYANIYSFIHTHELDQGALREVLSDADRMVHRKAFTPEEIDLLLGDDQAAAMAHFASPSTIVIGEKGYSVKWLYDHTTQEWAAEGITPEMVIAVQEHYYNPLFTQEAAKAFSQKLYDYTDVLTPVRLGQWNTGEVKPDGSVEEAEYSGVMLDVIEFCQYPDYPTGCESVSLYMLLNYYGVDVTVDQIYDLLPMGAQPYDDDEGVRHGANPEREFVGDPRSEYSYGVFNAPIAQVAEQFMPGVETKTGASIDDIKAILDTGNPVLAWYVSAPMRDIMYRWSWLDENGETVHWPGGEHAVVICGYDEDSITYRDPNAGTTVVIDYDTFLKSFNELGGRIVYYTAPRMTALAEESESASRELIERFVVSFAAYGERDMQAMDELAEADPVLAKKWNQIMDLWEAPVSVNEELPDDLPDDDTLCLVALGFQLNPDGTMRDELIERLKVLLIASEKYPQAVIVCTGGGTAADDPTATEARKMANWLYEQGVDPSRVYVEDQSITTAQNAIFTFDILEEHCPQVKQIAIISSDYHIATGTLLFGAEAILRGSPVTVNSNAAWHAPSGTLSAMFQAGALIELSGDVETAFEIYYETYDIHELPPLHNDAGSQP